MVQSIREAMQQASLAGMRMRLDRKEVGLVQGMHESIVEQISSKAPQRAAQEMRRHMGMATELFGARAGQG